MQTRSKMTNKFPIKDIFNVEKGSLQSSKNTPGKYNFITASSEWKNHNTFSHDCEAIIVAVAASGSLGRTHYVNGKFISSDLCFILTPKKEKKVNLKFFFHYFNFIRSKLVAELATGTSKLAINKENFEKFEIVCPDYDLQSKLLTNMEFVNNKHSEKAVLFKSNFELIQNLRQSILSDAVSGKLVPQNSKDELASELLKRIKAEKEKLIKEKKAREVKSLQQIIVGEIPFEIPKSWEWTRLSNLISSLGDGIHGTPNYSEKGDFFFINGNNLNDGVIEIKSNTKRVSKKEFTKHKKELNNKTVFVSINGTIGNVAFYNDEKVILGKSACYFNLLNDINKYYIKLLIKTNYFQNYAATSATGTTIQNVSLESMHLLPVPLPPFAEQGKIVEKVDQLMILCDELEEKIKENQNNSELLMEAVLREAFDSE